MNDTIAAISTAMGVGAISIIRVSGDEAVNIVNTIVKNKNLNSVSSHTINYNHVIKDNTIIDEVLISIMRAPKTFTCEDVVEINAHGGIATTNKILQLLIEKGCRLAEPGEFTKRAFLNGRIDLTQAEGVMDLINSKTDRARELALSQVSGEVSKMIRNLRQEIIEILANIEVNIDYPEYEDIDEVTNELVLSKIVTIENKIKNILNKSENCRLVREGIMTAIIGKPNVGKSSLLNLLLEEDKAIVTDVEGTTRDFVEGKLIIDGIIFNIIDTAGIRDTSDIVESIGVNKSIELIDNSDLVLLVFSNNEPLTPEDFKILEKVKNKNYIIIINKIDLDSKIDLSSLDNIVRISVLDNIGIEDLKNRVREIFHLEHIETDDLTYLSNARSIALLNDSLVNITSIKEGVRNNIPIDMIELDIKEIWNKLGSIIGDVYQEELIDQLFSQFCLGK